MPFPEEDPPFDTTPPAEPVVVLATVNNGGGETSIDNVAYTYDQTINITGTAEAFSTVFIYAIPTDAEILDSSDVTSRPPQGFAFVDGNGEWSLTTDPLGDWNFYLYAVAEDAAGNLSDPLLFGGIEVLPSEDDVIVTLGDTIVTSESATVTFTVANLNEGSKATIVFSDEWGQEVRVDVEYDGEVTEGLSSLQGFVAVDAFVTDKYGTVFFPEIVGTVDTPVCFCAGTRIATPNGDVPVEALRPGDLVLTADGGVAPVLWLGRQTIHAGRGNPLATLPIRIRAGALAAGVPGRDLRVSPAHALLVGGVLVNAGALVNGTSILREQRVPRVFRYFHVELAAHSLLLAEGAPAESFVDHMDRSVFDNGAERLARPGGASPIPEMDLPRAASQRQVPQAVRALIAARAAALAAAPVEPVLAAA